MKIAALRQVTIARIDTDLLSIVPYWEEHSVIQNNKTFYEENAFEYFVCKNVGQVVLASEWQVLIDTKLHHEIEKWQEINLKGNGLYFLRLLQ